jgi:hypothetical protein
MKVKTKIAPLAALLTLLFSSQAGAVFINFVDLTEGTDKFGESSWGTLSVPDAFGLKATGHATDDNDSSQFAYLDWGNAGLGVCKDAVGAPSGANPNSGANSCQPSSDDNVTINEYLEFVFDENVKVEALTFNNNHDGGFATDASGIADMVTINGADYAFSLLESGNFINVLGFAPITLLAGDVLTVAYKNEQFYVSGMTVSAVPVPAAVWLFGSALLGFVGYGRRTSVS